jgi:hypothetical protein
MKKKWLYLLGILAVIGVIAAVLVYFFVYNKPHKDYSKAKPEVEIEAVALFESFRNDAQAASAEYNGKVVAISGEITGVEQTDGLTILVMALDEGMFGSEGIRCTMIPELASAAVATPPGSKVRVKGLLTGYNETDVILEHCSLVE